MDEVIDFQSSPNILVFTLKIIKLFKSDEILSL